MAAALSPEPESSRAPLAVARSAKSTAVGAYLEGWRRVRTAPFLVLGAFLVLSLPWFATQEAAAISIGTSASVLTDQLLGFGSPAAPLVRAFGPSPLPLAVGGVALAYLVLVTFVTGGILDRLARARRLGGDVFLATCGRHTWRLLRLGALTGAGYWIVLRGVIPSLDGIVDHLIVGSQPTQGRLLAAAIVAWVLAFAVLSALTVVADFARVRMVVEDRFSALASWGAGWRFVRRRKARVAGLLLLNLVTHVVLLRLWLQVSPTVEAGGTWALVLVPVFLLARTAVRLAVTASEVVFFQGDLAHATYAAAPVPLWPESASVEAVRNLRRLR